MSKHLFVKKNEKKIYNSLYGIRMRFTSEKTFLYYMNDDFTLFIFVATLSRARDTPNLFPSTAELLEFMQKRKPRVKTRHLLHLRFTYDELRVGSLRAKTLSRRFFNHPWIVKNKLFHEKNLSITQKFNVFFFIKFYLFPYGMYC